MASCGKADHADAARVNSPFLRPAADDAHRPLGVDLRTERRLSFDVARAARAAVFQDDARHAAGIEPGRDLLPFQLPEQIVVAAPGTNQHRRAVVLLLWRRIN